MSFRFNRWGALLLLGMLCASVQWSCGLNRDSQSTTQTIQFGKDTGCLDKTPETWKNFFAGQSSAGELSAFSDCVSGALDLFAKNVKGAKEGIYSSEELRRFLQNHYLKTMTISDALLAEVMAVKQSFVGGTANQATLADLQELKSIIRTLSEQAITLLPYMPLNSERLKSLPDNRFDDTLAAVESATHNIGLRFSKGRGAYRFESFIRLLQALRDTDGLNRDTISWADPILKQMKPFQTAKGFLMASSDKEIAPTEWSDYLPDMTRVWALGLRMNRLKSQEVGISLGKGREDFVQITSSAFDLLAHVETRYGGVIPFSALDRLLDLVKPSTLGLDADGMSVLKRAIRPFVQRFLGGADFGVTGRNAKGVSALALRRLQAQLNDWNQTQIAIETAYANNNADKIPGGLSAIDLPPGQSSEVRELLSDNLSSFAGKMIYFKPHQRSPRHSLESISKLNWMKKMAELAMRGYSEIPKVAAGPNDALYVSEVEFEHMYHDFFDLGVTLKFFDPRNVLAAQQRFRESNIFLYVSDGDQTMSLVEGSQLLSFMFSGRALADEIHDLLATRCKSGGDDGFGYTLITDVACIHREFSEHFGDYFSSLPGLVAYYNQLGNVPGGDLWGQGKLAQQKFIKTVGSAIRYSGYSIDPNNPKEPPMDSREMDVLGLMAQYVEALFIKWDENRDDVLRMAELNRQLPTGISGPAKDAFGIFKGTLREIPKVANNAAFKSDKELRSLFYYLIDNGQPPVEGVMGEISFVSWAGWQRLWNGDISGDRMKVFGIFSSISKMFSCQGNTPGSPCHN